MAIPPSSPFGLGTYGSRSARRRRQRACQGGRQDHRQGQEDRRHLLEASEQDIEFEDGVFTVAGTDRSKSFGEIAFAAYNPPTIYPLETLEPGLEEKAFYDPINFTYPGGCHIAEVEIDPETGVVDLVAYTAVDDVGTVLNPMIVEGPGAWRRRAGRRPGPVRELRLRSGNRAAPVRLVHGLLHAARRRSAEHSQRRRDSTACRTIRSASKAAARSAPSPRRRR